MVRFARTVAVLLATAALLAGCGTAVPPGDAGRIGARPAAELSPADAAVSGAINAFGFDLLAELSTAKKNAVTSPVSMATLLAMLLAGADGKTATEIAAVLHLDDSRDRRVGGLLHTVADTEDVTLAVANAIWTDVRVTLQPGYRDYVRSTFGASTEEAELGSPDTAAAIDRWASDQTRGRIDKIAQDLELPSDQVVMVLVNAVYFLGQWTTAFDTANTRAGPFTLATGRKVAVPMMYRGDGEIEYASRPGYAMVRLPYGEDGRYAMEIMLPDRNSSLRELLSTLDARERLRTVEALAPQELALALPRFELTWGEQLNEELQALGMTSAFEPGADFSRMSSAAAAELSVVVQKTYLRVDEQGTEAAAVSGGAVDTSAPPEFRVDRPFAFAIADRQTGAILFLGAVADPTG